MFTKLQNWGNSHRIAVLDYFRVVVGLFITYKGALFMSNLEDLQALTSNMDIMFASAGIAHYVIFAHVLGGPLLAAGLYTRIMSLIQIPILIGAIMFVNYQYGFLSVGNHMELEISIVVLVSLCIFSVFGAGKFSVDNLRRKDEALHHHHHHY